MKNRMMKHSKSKLLLLFSTLALSTCAKSKTIYENGFDDQSRPLIVLEKDDPLFGTLYAFPFPLDFTKTKLSPKGGCYRRAEGHLFDSYTYSSKHVFDGSRSWRTEVRTDFPNSKGKCQASWVQNEKNKSRNELSVGAPVMGSHARPVWGQVQNGAPAQWYAFALFIPSDEGTYDNWIKKRERSIIVQFMGAGNSNTPEIHWMLGGGDKPTIDVEITTSSNPKEEELVITRYQFKLEPDRWHTFLSYWKRNWEESGQYKLWVDCKDWTDSSCEPTINRQGKVSIRDKPYATFQLGDYDSYVNTHTIRSLYWDSLRISDENSSWAEAASGLASPSPSSQGSPSSLK